MIQLKDLPDRYRTLDRMIEESGGEVTETIEFMLGVLEGELPEQVDSCRTLVRESELDAKALREESTELLRKARVAERKAELWKGWMMQTLEAAGVTSAKGRFKASIVPNSQPTVTVVNASVLPPQYQIVRVEADKVALRDAYEVAMPLPEGVTVERGRHLRFS